MSKMKFRLPFVLATVMLLAGCSASGQKATDAATPNFEPVETFAPVETPPMVSPLQDEAPSSDSISETAYEHCPDFGDALNLVNNWADVLGSRGSSTHQDDFAYMKELVEDLQAESARGAISCPAFDELADVNLQLSGVQIMVEHMDVPEDRFYQAVTNAGNEWLNAGDFEGLIFKTP